MNDHTEKLFTQYLTARLPNLEVPEDLHGAAPFYRYDEGTLRVWDGDNYAATPAWGRGMLAEAEALAEYHTRSFAEWRPDDVLVRRLLRALGEHGNWACRTLAETEGALRLECEDDGWMRVAASHAHVFPAMRVPICPYQRARMLAALQREDAPLWWAAGGWWQVSAGDDPAGYEQELECLMPVVRRAARSLRDERDVEVFRHADGFGFVRR